MYGLTTLEAYKTNTTLFFIFFLFPQRGEIGGRRGEWGEGFQGRGIELFWQYIKRVFLGKEPTARPRSRWFYCYTSTTSRMSATPASTHLVALALVFSPAVKTKVGPRCCVM